MMKSFWYQQFEFVIGVKASDAGTFQVKKNTASRIQCNSAR